MTISERLTVRSLDIADIDGYLEVLRAIDAGSGLEGEGHSHAYGRSESFDMEAARGRERTRWSMDIDEIGWRRAWGLYANHDLVGHLHLVGGEMRSDLHRVSMGMGVLRSHRRQGGGRLLLDVAIAWARSQPRIDWIDLGVFADNHRAQALYESYGFHVVGRSRDRYRVDGASLDEISMTLSVA